jgi:hypothetical protein
MGTHQTALCMERPTGIHIHWDASDTNMPEDFLRMSDEWKLWSRFEQNCIGKSCSCETLSSLFFLCVQQETILFNDDFPVAHELLMRRSDNAQRHAISTAFEDQVSRLAERLEAV